MMPGMSEQRTNRGGPLYWLKRRSRRFWIIAAMLPALYVVSFGPACWISSRIRIGSKAVPLLYAPLNWAWNHGGPSLAGPLHWYTCLFADENWEWVLDGEESKWIDLRIE
jgi:hypothetical protein